MPIPTISADDPVVEPAVAAKTYDAVWLRTIQIVTPQYGVGSIYIETVPMDSATGELHPSNSSELRCDLLWESVAAVQEVETALGAFLAAYAPLKNWIESQQ